MKKLILSYLLLVCVINKCYSQQQGQPPPPQQPHEQQQYQQPQQHQEVPPQQQEQQHNQQQRQQQHNQQQQQPNQQQQQQQQGQPPPGGRQFAANNEIGDQQHIASHLDGQINVDESKMSNEQLQFHYFTMHDLNKDSKLDGIELIKAITHWHGTEEDEIKHQPPKLEDKELEDMIDSILKDDDFNNDGYVDYSEFLKSQAGRQ